VGSMFEGAALRVYRDSLVNVHPLDRETERDLAKRWIKGDQRAGVKIVEACLPFVISIALEYRRWGVPLEDIVQQGNLGLLRAAKKFDPARECRLATYAVYWIRAEIREYVVRAYRVVRLGTTKAERRALRAYRTTKESDPESLARVSGLSVERVEQLLPLLMARETSLDANTNDLPPAIERMTAGGAGRADRARAAHRARADDERRAGDAPAPGRDPRREQGARAPAGGARARQAAHGAGGAARGRAGARRVRSGTVGPGRAAPISM
jgi:RNA polymerase sigma-32 factor